MRRLTIVTMVMLIAAMILLGSALETLAFTWQDFARLCRNASAEEMEAVLKQGNIHPRVTQENGNTLLMVAVENQAEAEIIELLIRFGVEVNAKNSVGETALLFAFKYPEPDPHVVTVLLNAGANPNDSNDAGSTPMSYAMRFSSQSFKETKAFDLLTQKAADLKELDERAKVNALTEAFSKRPPASQEGAFGPDLTGQGLLRLGTYYKNLFEIYQAGTLINPILYEDGNQFDLKIEVHALNTENLLMTFFYPAPTYEFTNPKNSENPSFFNYLSALLFRVAERLGIQNEDFWGGIASSIWLGYMPENFQLDGNDAISFWGYDRQANVKSSLPERRPPLSLKEEAEERELAKNRSSEDYLKMCDSYVPLVISIQTQAGTLRFLRKEKDSPYRLIECEFNATIWGPRNSYLLQGKDLASFILKKFGEKNGIEDMFIIQDSKKNLEQYYWKKTSEGYAIHIKNNTVKIFPILDEHTLYPVRGHKFISQSVLRKQFETEHPTVVDSKLEKTATGFSQTLIERRMTFDEFLERQLGDYAEMGFTGFGDSLELKH